MSLGQQFPGRQWCRHQYLQGYGQSILRQEGCKLGLETGEVALLGVEFGVVGGSSTHAVDEVDMREIRLYQMLYPDVKK